MPRAGPGSMVKAQKSAGRKSSHCHRTQVLEIQTIFGHLTPHSFFFFFFPTVLTYTNSVAHLSSFLFVSIEVMHVSCGDAL